MDSMVHRVAKSWTGLSGSPFPSLRCDHPASRVQHLPELPRVTSGSGRVSVEATGVSMFLHVYVYYACVPRHLCHASYTHVRGTARTHTCPRGA